MEISHAFEVVLEYVGALVFGACYRKSKYEKYLREKYVHVHVSRKPKYSTGCKCNSISPNSLVPQGHTKIVELLLTRGAHVDHQTKTGCTPLMEATREGHYEVLRGGAGREG